MKGKIKTKTDKGYGFIQVEGQDKDLFFHSNNLVEVTFDDLQEGDEVEFEVVKGDKGKRAENVKRV